VTACRQVGRQVDRSGGLAHPALLVGKRVYAPARGGLRGVHDGLF
jgi:hypothetical protein